jgi:hypothetical protein
MEKALVSILTWITFCVCIFLAWYFSHKAKHKECLMLIEKGVNLDEYLKKERGFSFPWLKLGIVIIGLSIGLAIIGILANLGTLHGSDALPLSILGICGGTSLVIANYINKNKSN